MDEVVGAILIYLNEAADGVVGHVIACVGRGAATLDSEPHAGVVARSDGACARGRTDGVGRDEQLGCFVAHDDVVRAVFEHPHVVLDICAARAASAAGGVHSS